LFDLFRATGQQESFEAMAIDFAGRFGRSAPVWFSIPEMISRMAAPAPAAAERPSDWNSPASLGTQSLVKLGLVLAKAKPPWTIDWGNLKTIEDMAIEPLRRLLSTWADQPVKLRFLRSAQLARVLKDATPSGQKNVSQEWWKLRLAALRVMHRPDEFELVALDYCVTYEVSPPSWDPARCEYKTGDSEADQASASTLIGEVYHDSVSVADTGNTFGDTLSGASSSQMTQMSAIELAGQIQGDATAVMDKLESRLGGADIMVISCSKLIRVDFSAAGTLLNWVTTQQTQGRIVQFNDVHRLVAAFFHVIGISEHAKISPRRD
jgi:ABC-type transporter Mla MlaB component